MKQISISHPTGIIKTTVQLPASKSISNRLLIINNLSRNPHPVENLSSSTDTQNLKRIFDAETLRQAQGDMNVMVSLSNHDNIADVHDAGTSMRFLAAYFCAINETKIITGTERMCERPIGELVNALRSIGFKIEYQKNDGYPPIKIIHQPNLQLKDTVELDASISSQYVSALLMIAPVLKKGLTVVLKTPAVSEPYIEMTLSLMKRAGINYSIEGSSIKVPPQQYAQVRSRAEADWSAASYWYIIAALSKQSEITLTDLRADSLQGDKQMAEWGKFFGVGTTFTSEGAHLRKCSIINSPFSILNFLKNPDLAQSLLVIAAALNKPMEFTGVSTLKVKETDRIEAMRTELKKINALLTESGKDHYLLQPNFRILNNTFETYKDHRMAMAFAPLALKGQIVIKNPEVVSKSYPEYWDHLKAASFFISKV